jgi:hypothetical protein
MGRKPPWSRQYLLLHLAAGLMLGWLAGCTAGRPPVPTATSLTRAEALLAQGRHRAAEEELGRITRGTGSVTADEALFLRALIVGDPRNPQTDPLAAAEYLDALGTTYPGSPRKTEAIVLRSLLLQLAMARQTTQLLSTERMGLHTRLEEAQHRMRVLEQRFERLKQVDLDTEQLKRRNPPGN